ncbi:hypothetical protein EDB85DRAFT_1896224 [Lactarius pseudohatsudake]|nr:hypothetical protein EDB85DRAFT_1896224 [Lactarius pseudohatsudake]
MFTFAPPPGAPAFGAPKPLPFSLTGPSTASSKSTADVAVQASSSSPPVPSGRPDRPAGKRGEKCNRSLPGVVDLSVFDILNIFRRQWFLSRAHLLTNVISAQKAEDGKISWVEFSPPFHSHLVKCAVALVPHPIHAVKRVMFVYILELLNGDGNQAFFDLQKGGRKANNAQKEKRRLTQKQSRAAKREREREAAKAAKLPSRERECQGCGRKFQSRKTAKKHKCDKNSKVVRKKESEAVETSSHPEPSAPLDKPASPPPPPAPTAPTHSHAVPSVTGVLRVPPSIRRCLFATEDQQLQLLSQLTPDNRLWLLGHGGLQGAREMLESGTR